ncbi:MAG TPA: LLM class flavin-dependent oxidoreductase [Polyangiaceae bacterium]|nr:LLM class flavin-dependent oxidoreductase [Polyangiaceae bacterium]
MSVPFVELAAVEAALREHPEVERVAVSARPAAAGEGAGALARVVPREGAAGGRELGFSLFYFADAEAGAREDKYRLYLEGARFADARGFEAVWTPERHFHENGGLYPNPSVLSAALATITERVRLRAGSVALPLHHPLRVAEEWSVVDNLSRGRVDLSFTSGWIPNDFAIAPQPGVFHRKRDAMFELIEQVRELWSGGAVPARDGVGGEVRLQIFPKPVQPRLPIWITCSGDPATFVRAGEMGFNVLTALLTQPLEEAAEKAALYRDARARAGLDPAEGRVTLMMHAFVGRDEAEVRAAVERPLTEYLKSHLDLMKGLVKSVDLKVDRASLSDPRLAAYLATFAFERYYRMGSLIGTPEKCLGMVDRVKALGFDEVACLIDFGVPAEAVLGGLPHLAALKGLSDGAAAAFRERLAGHVRERLGPGAPPLEVRAVSRLPPAPAPAGGRAAAEVATDVDERARRQRAAAERQRQQMRAGKKP